MGKFVTIIITGEAEGVTNYYPFGLLHNMQSYNFDNPYQMKYNGKELQETGMYDYGWRQYMSDLGRWGAVDNKAEKYDSSSPYHYAGNNPISNIDIDGNEFTPEAWQYINSLIADINRRQENNNASIAEYRAKIEAGGKAGQIKRWEKNIASLQENNAGMEEARSEIGVLANSNQVYNIIEDDSNSTGGKSISYSGFVFKSNHSFAGQFVIGLSKNAGIELLSHELKHAFQFETGETSNTSDRSSPKSFLYDKNDEVETYKRGSLFGGNIYSVNNLPDEYRDILTNPSNVRNNSEIIRALSLPPAQREQALKRISQTQNAAFRVNGKTYYTPQNSK